MPFTVEDSHHHPALPEPVAAPRRETAGLRRRARHTLIEHRHAD